MIALSHKSKHYGLIALKVLILSLTFGYIYSKITGQQGISFNQFIYSIHLENSGFVVLCVGLAVSNWILEILKWQTVVSFIEKLSFRTATRQSLAALTVSLATPNRIGDYGAKAYFFEARHRKQILLLNFFSNSVQMGVTVFFGCFGLIYAALKFGLALSTMGVVVGILLFIFFGIIGFVFKEKQLLIKGLTLTKLARYIKNLPATIQWKTLLFSFFRYAIFSFLFFLLLNFFGAEITLFKAIPIICAMYLLVSIVPTLFLFDVVIRGGVAVWLFGMANIPEWPVLATVFCMWMLNFVLPALWGSFYVLTHKRS